MNLDLDYRLVRAIREGTDALPDDVGQLVRYLRLIESLLAEKASEIEPTWELACAAATEVETLHALEAAVAERVIAIEADGLEAIRGKLAIWRALADGDEDGDPASLRNRLILSVAADLERLAGCPAR